VREHRLAQPEEDDRRLFFRVETDGEHGRRRFQVRVRRLEVAPGDPRDQEIPLFGRLRPGPEVDVVGAERQPGELRVRVRVFDGQPAAGEDADLAEPFVEPGGSAVECVTPRGLDEVAVGVADQRLAHPVLRARVLEGPAALVAVPLFVDVGVGTGETPQHLAPPPVGALLATGRAVLAGRRSRDEVERPGAEAVLRAGQRADGADLHGVAGEVGVERLVGVDADLLQRTALEQLDERVAGDLLGKARAPGAQHAALAVEQHLRGDRDRLFEPALVVPEPGLRRTVRQRLVL
jgi:hypothetical protein